MTSWLWLLLMIAVGLFPLIATVCCARVSARRARARRLAVWLEQSEAERQLQRQVQDTVQRLFQSARRSS